MTPFEKMMSETADAVPFWGNPEGIGQIGPSPWDGHGNSPLGFVLHGVAFYNPPPQFGCLQDFQIETESFEAAYLAAVNYCQKFCP